MRQIMPFLSRCLLLLLPVSVAGQAVHGRPDPFGSPIAVLLGTMGGRVARKRPAQGRPGSQRECWTRPSTSRFVHARNRSRVRASGSECEGQKVRRR